VGSTGPVYFAEMTLFTPFRDLLHAASLRNGANGFTSLPKEAMLRIFLILSIISYYFGDKCDIFNIAVAVLQFLYVY
jgi:hypothetical protein